MLDAWALRAGRLKKAVYWRLIERKNLERAACLRALTENEADQYRELGLKTPIAVIPNGVSVPARISSEQFFGAYPRLRDFDLLLFLGRIHPKKGVDVLLEAWSKVHGDFPRAHLVIAGPGQEEMQEKLERIIRRSDLAKSLTFTGMLQSDLKWSALAAAKAFVLPSHSEGFSVAVLEALAAGTPAIVSKQCYFPEIKTAQCGWVIDPVAAPLSEAIASALSLQATVRSEMAERGRGLVNRDFTWSAVGRKAAEVLDWVRIGKQPATVRIIA
jgi:glycosyltransferase involved in cell wall biosynthesis